MTSLLVFFISAFLMKISDAQQLNSNSLFSQRNSKFATDLYVATSQTNRGNFVFSPFSIQLCGALLYSGSDGVTANELVQGFRLIRNDRSTVVKDFFAVLNDLKRELSLSIANKIYFAPNIRVKPTFHQIATQGLSSEEEIIDFSRKQDAAAKINYWVREATRNKIFALFDGSDFDASVYMALVNTIYFKGEWTIPFDIILRRNFSVSPNYTKEVDMMYQLDDYEIGFFPELDAKVLKVPYINANLCMLIILPNQRDGLIQLERQLPGLDLVNLQNRLNVYYVQVGLPKFSFETYVDLKNVLTRLGMGSLFAQPNFSNMMENKNVKVDKGAHKAFISVTELGTEAGAATGFSMHYLTKPEVFVADRPFIFTIVSKTAVLFLGRYVG